METEEAIKQLYPKLIANHKKVLERYLKLNENDADEAYKLSKLTIQLADNWNELQLNSKKIADLTGCKSATSIKDYARHNYNILIEAHTTCRMVWKYVNDNTSIMPQNKL